MTFISSDNSILISELTSCKFDFKAATPFVLHTLDSTSIDFSGDGTVSTPLTAVAKLSTSANNLLTINSTGLFLDGAYFNIYLKNIKVSSTDAGTSQYLQDKVQAGTNISITKITTVDGEKLVFDNTAGATALVYADSSTLDFSGSGITGDAFTGSVKISTTAGNALIANSTGLYVPTPSSSGESTLVASDSSTIAFTTSGTAGHSLTAGVKISSTAGNTLSVSGSGLYVPTPTLTQDVLVATDSLSINFTTTGAFGHGLTGEVIISPDSGNALGVRSNGLYASGTETSITVTPSESIDIALSGTANHNLIPNLKISASSGNSATINSDGLYVANSVSGTTNYIAKFNTSTSVGNSLIYDSGTNIVVNGTSGVSTFNVVGTSHFDLTETYSSGASYAIGSTYTPTYTGSLPTSNTSFALLGMEYRPTFSGTTAVGGDTPMSCVLANTIIKFTGSGSDTVTMNNGSITTNPKTISAIHVGSFDLGTINGTVSKTAGIQIDGIFRYSGSTATITRTNHYQLLINDINEFGFGGNATNKFAIYQTSTTDISRFFGPVQNASSSVQFTSDARVKDNFELFTRGLDEIDAMTVKTFEYTYNKGKRVVGLVAQELEQVLPEAVSIGTFELPDESEYFTDFRMVDQTTLFYTMLNAIKQLSAKVKALESSK